MESEGPTGPDGRRRTETCGVVWCMTARKERLYSEIRDTLHDAALRGKFGTSITEVRKASSYYLRLRTLGKSREEALQTAARKYPAPVYHSSALWRILAENNHELPMTDKAFFRLQQSILGHDPRFHREPDGSGWSVNGWAAREPDDPTWHRPVLVGRFSAAEVTEIRKKFFRLRRAGKTRERAMAILRAELHATRTLVWDIVNPNGRYREVGTWPEATA